MNLLTLRRIISRCLQGGVLLVLVVAASYVSIGRILIANVDRYRTSIESMVSDALSVPVTIGQIEGDWHYLDPTIEMLGVTVGLDEHISVNRVSVTLDTIGSLRERMPILNGFGADGLRLTLAKQNGRWGLVGIPTSDKPMNADPVLTSLNYLSAFDLSDISIQIVGEVTDFVIRSDPNQHGELKRDGDLRSLALPLLLVESGIEYEFLLSGQYAGKPGESDSTSELYMRLPLLPAQEFFPEQLIADLDVHEVKLGGDFWLNHEGEAFELIGQSQLRFGFAEARHELRSALNFATRGMINGEITASIEELSGDFDGIGWQLNDIGVAYEPGPEGNQIAIQIPTLEVDQLVETLLEMGDIGLLLNAEQMNVLSNLRPSGAIHSLMAVVQLRDGLDFHVMGELDGISVERYLALPMISDLNGLLSLGPKGGFLDMMNEDRFSLQFPGLFDSPWFFDSAKTRVTYSVTDSGIQAQSGLVEARDGELMASGRFHIKLPGDPLETTWGLELGVQQADLLDAFRYIPNTLKEDVRQWLEDAVLAGFSRESGMVFHGSLARQADKDQKAHQLYFKVEDTILDYDQAWPRFDELTATIFLDNFEISSGHAEGKVFDSEVFDAKVMVPISADGVADTILIDGRLRGDLSDGLRVLTETPLLEATNGMAQAWAGTGAMQGHAVMNIPMGDRSLAGEPTIVDLDVSLTAASLIMPELDLRLDDLKGDFNYGSHTAVTSNGFNATLFSEPVTGRVLSNGDINGGEITIRLDGAISATDLFTWSEQPLLSKVEGLMNYEAGLHVFYGNRDQEETFVRAESDLAGVDIDLPRPMKKNALETMALNYKQIFLEDSYRIELKLGEEVEANLKVADAILAGGRLHFGHEPMGAISFDQLAVSGALAHVTYEEWDQLMTDLGQVSEGSLEEELEQTLDAIEVTIGLFDVYGFEMENVLTTITRAPDAWHVDLDNEWMLGRVSVSDDDAVPLNIAMQRLLFESELEATTEDPLGQVSPAELTLAQFSVEQLLIDGEDYGSWSFLYEPGEQGAFLKNLRVDVKGLQTADDASVRWEFEDGQHKSYFRGTVLVPNLAFALTEWGYASSIEGEDFRFYGDVDWPGSPAMVEMETIDGLIRIIQGEGSFVQADSNMEALSLLGIFDFAALARRFSSLDFSDVVQGGYNFSEIEGEVRFRSGVVDVVDPIMIEGAGSTIKVAGRVDLIDRSLDNDLIVTLPVNRNLPWYAAYSAIATGPLTGAGVFLAQKVFQNQINAISSAKYKVTGSMDKPLIEFVTIFSDSVRETPEDLAPGGD